MKIIPLTQNKVAMVDDEDFEILNSVKWCAVGGKGKFYAFSRKRGKMCKFLMNPKKPLIVDHIDGDGLNNQRSNLRICTQSQNLLNRKKKSNKSSSRFKGVYFHSVNLNWVAFCSVNRKLKHIGVFQKEEDAAKAHDMAAFKMYGQFAHLNFKELIS